MRTIVTVVLLVGSLIVSIWLYTDSSAPLHDMMTHYTTTDVIKQIALAVCAILFSFGIGRFFKD